MQQIRVEKFLYDHAAAIPSISLRYGWCVCAVQDLGDAVRTTTEDFNTGATKVLYSKDVVGCDGPRGLVRRSLGIRYRGEGGAEREFMGGQMVSTHFRARQLYAMAKGPPATMYWTFNRTRRAVLISANGRDEFFMFSKVAPGAELTDDAVRGFVRAAVGVATPIEIIASKPWIAGHSLVAERYGLGRTYIAGDAAHLFTPTGGFGYNTAIDDVANLAWKLAACVQGWGGPALLPSYEQERLPVAIRNTEFAARLSDNIGKITIADCIEDASLDGIAARQALGKLCLDHARLEFDCPGLQLGVHYGDSDIISHDAAPPADDPNRYLPSAAPGSRMPHLWLDRQISTLDRVQGKFTLIRLGGAATKVAPLRNATDRHGVPLDVVDIEHTEVRDAYGYDLVLIRPDQHIAWRGNSITSVAEKLLRKATGWQ